MTRTLDQNTENMARPSIPSILALVISIVALVVSLASSRKTSDEIDIAAEVDMALAAREKKLAEEFSPKMEEIYADMLGSREAVFETPPETLSELLAPALRVIQGISGEN